ncbi:hypothetical protein D6783_02545 [Candidatus Woesearchaeota archaeon]|nr:MAG: hypothetical protein D6783_02545 [Candidatus Woesearchaeota archaeon]
MQQCKARAVPPSPPQRSPPLTQRSFVLSTFTSPVSPIPKHVRISARSARIRIRNRLHRFEAGRSNTPNTSVPLCTHRTALFWARSWARLITRNEGSSSPLTKRARRELARSTLPGKHRTVRAHLGILLARIRLVRRTHTTP